MLIRENETLTRSLSRYTAIEQYSISNFLYEYIPHYLSSTFCAAFSQLTVWHFCCVTTMYEYKQQSLTRQQEMHCYTHFN